MICKLSFVNLALFQNMTVVHPSQFCLWERGGSQNSGTLDHSFVCSSAFTDGVAMFIPSVTLKFCFIHQ